ncbi:MULTISPECIES: LysR family transcriptional regulator [Paenibacillus]|uniref:LysR family transcriptional regulator n=1 Tax=Paenibacillus TaxID=44249 RepID=UPI000885F4B1|nr:MULTISPECIES: LysR family transcriptional regulator [Paenibacillus]SDH76040.1 DNA-binding transcriptional regulator, LysR family [Paenibacillus naphthalenovorans]
MELRHLRYFVTVAEELHFGRAASRLNIAQPPLSQQIRQLEDELGFPLLFRTKQRVELTEAGKVFLEECRLCLAHIDRAIDAAGRANKGEIGRLDIGFVGSATYSIVPFLQRYRLQYPSVNLMLHQMKTTNQIQALHDGRIHLAIVRTPIQSPFLTSKIILKERFIAALPQKHPLTRKRKLHMQDLAGEHFIISSRNNGSIYHDAVIQLCYKSGYRPNVSLEAPEILTIVAFVSEGMGVALVPDSFRNQKNKGVIYRDLEDVEPCLEMSLVWRNDEKSQVLNEFLKCIK